MSVEDIRHLLVWGGDEFQVAACVRTELDATIPVADRAFGLEIVEGGGESADAAVQVLSAGLESLQTQGFLGGARTVWIRDAAFLADAAVLKDDRVRDLLEALQKELEAGQGRAGNRLILSAPAVDARIALVRWFTRHKATRVFDPPTRTADQERQAKEVAREAAERLGLRFSPGVQEAFLQRTGHDARLIAAELEKLDLYLAERRVVEQADVEALVPLSQEFPVWDLLDAMWAGKVDRALDLLHQLLQHGDNPVGLVIALESSLRTLLVLLEVQERGWLRFGRGARGQEAQWSDPPEAEALLADLSQDPRKMHPYRLLMVAEKSRGLRAAWVRRVHERVAKTHEQLVSTGVAEDVAVELLVLRLARGARALRARAAQTA